MQLSLSKNMITGNLAGKPIHCVVRMSPGTGSPAPGEYIVPPPASDAIFGQTALMIPVKPGSSGFASAQVDYFFKGGGQAQVALKMGFAPASKEARPVVPAALKMQPGVAPSHHMLKVPGLASSAGGGAMESAGGAGAERQSLTKEVLVLSDKPIAGRNCLIVSLGFADLMLGLQASGGAALTVR